MTCWADLLLVLERSSSSFSMTGNGCMSRLTSGLALLQLVTEASSSVQQLEQQQQEGYVSPVHSSSVCSSVDT
jgi:hypothetical protein